MNHPSTIPVPLKAVCITGVLVFACSTSRPAAAVKEADFQVPADFLYSFTPLPAGENAVCLWREAGNVIVSPTARQKAALTYCWTPSATEPPASDLDEIRAWLKQNRESLKLFAASLAKPGAQWLERNPLSAQPEL